MNGMLKDSVFVLFWMVFMHIADDYYLQGWLASAKQKSWWEKNAPDKLYEYDYLAALGCHGFSWAFMTMLPLAIYHYNTYWCIFVCVNAIIHQIVDNMKANKKTINLCIDQILHIVQLVVSHMLYIVFVV